MLLTSLIPKGEFGLRDCHFLVQEQKWVTPFEHTLAKILSQVKKPLEKEPSPSVEVIPVIKESNHWLYNVINQSFKQIEKKHLSDQDKK